MPDAIRTHDLQSRSLTLYPAELRTHIDYIILQKIQIVNCRICDIIISMKKITNKLNMFFLLILCLALSFVLFGCSDQKETVIYDVGTFVLSDLTLDGKTLSVSEVYPEGAWLQLSSNGRCRLTMGNRQCETGWTDENGVFSFSVGDLKCSGRKQADRISFAAENTGMQYEFTPGSSVPPQISAEDPDTSGSGGSLDGEWKGRLWYENTQGEWSNFEYQTESLSASVRGTTLTVFDRNYSESEPMMQIGITSENGAVCCTGGYFMSYPIPLYGMEIQIREDLLSSIRDTVIIEKPGDFGHVFTAEPPETDPEETVVDVIRMSGTCRDSAGSFDYFIELTRQ